MASTVAAFETPIALDRDVFMRQLIASLGHLNEGILGSDIAGAYIMNVGLSMGAAIEAEYKRFWEIDRPFTLDEYAHVIVDLKQKIKGNFSLVSKEPGRVVVRTTSCPFDAFVRQSPSLCFMTSSVFGGIAARNFGYAKVALQRRIALGDPGCYVTVYLDRSPEALAAMGREYFPDVDRASPDIREQLQLMENVGRLRRELGQTNAQWEEVVRGAVNAICVIEPDGTISFANARWRDLLGVEGQELVGSNFGHLFHPSDSEGARQTLAQAMRGEREAGAQWRLRHRDESWREVQVSIGPVRDDQGTVTGLLAIFHDVTAVREMQRLKDDFLSSASHEIRTPVATIRAMTELLLRTIETEGAIDNALLARRLQAIQRQADRLALLGVDLLDASQLQSGKLRVRAERHDLNEIAAEAVGRQQALLDPQRAHHLALHLAPEPLPVAVERQRIVQVVESLLENAVKYSPGGGEIVVRLGRTGGWAVVTVSDPGIGIPAAELEKIFTPFFRGSNASIHNFSGLGLGLYLSRTIVENHGGTLTAHSAEGAGATFTLALPSDQHPGEAQSESDSTHRRG